MHSGIGGLAHVLAEVRATRAWTDGGAGAGRRDRRPGPARTPDDGDVLLLRRPGQRPRRPLRAGRGRCVGGGRRGSPSSPPTTAGSSRGWRPRGSPRTPASTTPPSARRATSSGAVWAHRHGTPGAAELAHRAADLLLAEAEPTEAGTELALRAAALHGAGAGRARRHARCPTGRTGWPGSRPPSPSPVSSSTARTWWTRRAAARSTSSPSVTRSDGGFVVPHVIPPDPDMDEVTYSWCHGPTGTSLLFTALEHAGVDRVAGETPAQWHRRCLHAIRTSGIPERRRPGLLGQRRPLLRHRRGGRGVPRRLAAARGRRRPRLRAGARRRARRAGRVDRGRRPRRAAGASPSTATRTPCSRPASAGCRVRPASRRTSCASPASCARDVRRPRSRASTPGGTCRERTRSDLRVRRQRTYERFRPAYPVAVVDEVLAYAGRRRRDCTGDRCGDGQGHARVRGARHRGDGNRARRCDARRAREARPRLGAHRAGDVRGRADDRAVRPRLRGGRPALDPARGPLGARRLAARARRCVRLVRGTGAPGRPGPGGGAAQRTRAVPRRRRGAAHRTALPRTVPCSGPDPSWRRPSGSATSARSSSSAGAQFLRSTSWACCRRCRPTSGSTPTSATPCCGGSTTSLPDQVDVVGDITLHLARLSDATAARAAARVRPPVLRLDQPGPDRVARQLDAVAHPELAEDVGAVSLDGLERDVQRPWRSRATSGPRRSA